MSRPVIARWQAASKRFGAVLALDRFSLDIHAGEVLAVLGPNGAGKTTALGLLTGLIRASSGHTELFGKDPASIEARRGMGVMLQTGDPPDTLTVAEHVRLFSGYYPQPRPLAETLAMAQLSELAQRRYGALSGGQQRRLQFALAICGRPQLLLVDEPTTGLDVEARRSFWQVLRGLVAQGTAVVLTTHYLEEADALADRVALIQQGRLVALDTPLAIKSRVGGQCLRFRSTLSDPSLAQLPGVLSVRRDGSHFELRATEVERLLPLLLAADPGLRDLTISAQSLENAVVDLIKEAA
ncbi:MAG: ABC transporter ATP-binding protein [Rhodanobacteraceae bacterium]|nr:ABC transporter ATP-binding protein [Rhodanobacteraceae bacterium]